MATWYLSNGQYANVATWAASTPVTVGAIVRQLATPTQNNERCFRCTTAGTTGATEPTWVLTKGSTTSDGSAVWTEVTGQSTYGWSAPFARYYMLTQSSWFAAGDTCFIGDDHNEVSPITANTSWTLPGTPALPNYIYCVDHTKSSPGVGDLKTGASIASTGNFSLSLPGTAYYYGITVICNQGGSGAVASLSVGNGAGNSTVFEQCTLALGSTFNNCSIGLCSTIKLIDCTFSFPVANNQQINQNGIIEAKRCKIVGPGTGGVFTYTAGALFLAGNVDLTARWDDCDFSNFTSGNLFANLASFGSYTNQFTRCKFNSGITYAAAQTGNARNLQVDFLQCDSGSSIMRNERYRSNGTSVVATTVARTGGAQDGTTPISHHVTTTANCRWVNLPFEAFPIAIYNPTAGSSVNVTVECLADPRDWSALPNNDEVWIDVEYLGNASSPLGTTTGANQSGIPATTKANNLATGTAQTASTADWTAGATARANSTNYSVGNIFSVPGVAAKLFVVTSITGSGTSASSDPGYSGVADGGTITDGQLTVKAFWRFNQTVAITPQAAGILYVQPKIAKASVANGVYIDPLVTLH